MARTSEAFMPFLLGDTGNETGSDRELRGGQRERLFRELDRHAVDLEHDAAGLDPAHPELRRALALAHAHFDRLLRHRHVRIDADPHPARALHVTGKRAAGSLDLARGDAFGLHRLEAELAEVEVGARLGIAVDAALVRLAELGAHRLQHGGSPSLP